ncbi:MAG: tRNA (adenosine(37)-N6)-dimethylallyltransferase MiaA [Candidatus Paceibacterota bacterium]|jgi:tRNA dimethylallyltransferase
MKKLLVILGQTAIGKSSLAIRIAKLFNGEIISADSRQVYQGMDIGTGKVSRDKIQDICLRRQAEYYSNDIRHHLLNIADPKEYFSVAQYQKLALSAIKDIQKRDKLPILCGGTGLYLSVIIEGWQLSNVPPDSSLRQKLEKLNLQDLFLKLQQLDLQRAKTIDKNNKRRLVRAIEIATFKGNVPLLVKKPFKWDILILGIKKNGEELKKIIKLRLEKRLEEGMIDEIKKLKENGVNSKKLEDFGLEYRWINRYLEKKITLLKMKKELYQSICHYAKRQMTWFKKIKNVCWIENEKEAIKLTDDFLSN